MPVTRLWMLPLLLTVSACAGSPTAPPPPPSTTSVSSTSTTTTTTIPVGTAARYVATVPQEAGLPPTTLDLTLFFKVLGSLSPSGRIRPAAVAYDITGTFTLGNTNGTITGSLDSPDGTLNGTFKGTFTTRLGNGCTATQNYQGPLTLAALTLSSLNNGNNCGGASPLPTVPVTAVAAPVQPTTTSSIGSTTTSVPPPNSTTTSPSSSTSTSTVPGPGPSSTSTTSITTIQPTTTTTSITTIQPTTTTTTSITTIQPTTTTTSITTIQPTTTTTSTSTTTIPVCSFSVNPSSASFPSTGGAAGFTVTASDPTCRWYAFEADSLSFNGISVTWNVNSPFTGTATLNGTVQANPTFSPQSGRVIISLSAPPNTNVVASYTFNLAARPGGH